MKLCSYNNLKELFDGDVLVGFIKEEHYEVKLKKDIKYELLVGLAKRAWNSYLIFQANRTDESFYAFLHDFREFAYDKEIKIANSDISCYDTGFISLMMKGQKRLGRKVYAKLMEYHVDVAAMAELYCQTFLKTESPFFDYEKLY